MIHGLAIVGLLSTALCAEQWAPVRCFPEGYDDAPLAGCQGEELFVDEMDEFAQWRVLSGAQNAPASLRIATHDKMSGTAALAVDYQFEGRDGFEYVAIAGGFTIAAPGCGLALWVKGDGTELWLRARVADSSGETFQFDVARLAFIGWRQVGALLRTPRGRWGGDGNGEMDYPCKFDSLVIDRPSRGFTGEGTILLDRLALLREAKQKPPAFTVEAHGRHVGNIYEPGEEIVLRVIPVGI